MAFSSFITPLDSGAKGPIPVYATMDPNWQTYDDYFVRLLLDVEEPYRSGTFTAMDLEIHQRPGKNYLVAFNVARLLEGRLGYDRPDLQGIPAATVAANVARRFQIRLEEVKNGVVNTSVSAPVRHAYLAGFRGNKVNEISLYKIQKKFLTHQPLFKIVSPYQPEFLYFIAPADDTYELTVDLYHDDDTTTIGHLPGISVAAETGDVIIFPTGHQQLGLDSINPSVIKWDVYLNNSYSEVRTYEIDCHCSAIERFYLMANSLGGFDTVRTTGELSVKDETEGQRIEKEIGFFYDSQTRTYQDIDRTTQEVCTQHTGHLSREENYWLKDLLLTQDAYRIGDYYPNLQATGDLVPIVIDAGSVGRYQDQEFLYGFPFNYREAFESRGI